jgi:putative FmdB family regulatory protein
MAQSRQARFETSDPGKLDMPIFAYRCDSCGFEKDALQKRSDPPLTTCPECGRETFNKRLTAPAFQLKGSGWYVTDFRDNGKTKAKPGESGDAAPAPAPSATGAESKEASGATPKSGEAAKPAPAVAPAAAPAAASAGTGSSGQTG